MKLTIDQAKTMLEHFGEMQKNGAVDSFSCPRCGLPRMNEKPTRNALSRRANVYICDRCGTEEALLDAARMEPIPLNEWAMTSSFGK